MCKKDEYPESHIETAATYTVETVIDDFIADAREVIHTGHAFADHTTEVFIAHHIPDSITGKHNHLILLKISIDHRYLRLRRDELFGWTKVAHSLVGVITQRSKGVVREIGKLNGTSSTDCSDGQGFNTYWQTSTNNS